MQDPTVILTHMPTWRPQHLAKPQPHTIAPDGPAARRTVVFFTRLGWMGLLAHGGQLARLVFGHRTAAAAHATLAESTPLAEPTAPWLLDLVARLQAYAEGAIDQFADVELDLGTLSAFRREVIACLRRVPYGETLSYGELARLAGRPKAARAVGACMAANPVPIIVPCHRVLASQGKLGGYSAPGGMAMKRRLLALESHAAHGRHPTATP